MTGIDIGYYKRRLKLHEIEFLCAENRAEIEIEQKMLDIYHSLWYDYLTKIRYNHNHDDKGRFCSGGGGSVKGAKSENMALEYQRYGRNKGTLVNKSYIESGEYRRKFDKLSDNPEINKTLYNCAKTALKHRSGTELEDMYWIDSKTGKVVASELDNSIQKRIVYSDKTKSAVNSYKENTLIALHTHPGSMPPSAADFNACYNHGYKCGYIACHNGKIFGYTANEAISERLYSLYIESNINKGYSEYDSQLLALKKIMQNHSINFWEVK